MNTEGHENCDNDDDDLFAVFDAPTPAKTPLTPLTSLLPASDDRRTSDGAPRDAAAGTPAAIMRVVCASSQSEPRADDVAAQREQRRLKAAAAVREPNSAINVSRPTKSCEQLPLVLAQFPFCTFVNARRHFDAVGAPAPSLTVIGVVIRKTDPKQKNGKNTFSVISLWNMQGPFPTPPEELSILLGGSAFDVHYTRLANGVVLALSGLQPIESRGSASPGTVGAGGVHNTAMYTGNKGNDRGNSRLVKAVKSEQIRVLGYAADLGVCQGIQQRSGEHCNNIVNVALSKFCSHHVSDLRREARGGTLFSTTAKPRTPCGGATRSATGSFAGVPRLNVLERPSISSIASKSNLQRLVREQPSFLTVKGSCGLPVTTPSSSDVTFANDEYAGVVPNGALPVTGMCRNVGGVYSSPLSLGVTTRGRAVLAAAVDQEDAKERLRLLQLAMRPNKSGTKRTRDGDPPSATTTAAQEVERIREQYAPLKESSASTSFAPMRCSGFDEVAIRRDDYQHRIVTKRSNGTTSALVSAVERSLKKDGARLTAAAATIVKEGDVQRGQSHQQHGATSSSSSVSLLSAVAGSMQSVNDDLRTDDERRRFEQRTQRRLAQDKALEVLSGVTEQTVKGVYCRQCDRWYLRRNERCKVLQHTLEAGETTRQFIECAHCGYKTSVLGDVRPSKRIPRCPRCCVDAAWRVGSAAPELAAPKDVPPQL